MTQQESIDCRSDIYEYTHMLFFTCDYYEPLYFF